MFLRAVGSQTSFLLKRKGAIITFYILFSMVLFNFMENVVTFQGRDVTNMYQPMKLLLLSYNRVNYNADMTILFIQLYPILVVCPAGFALAREYQSGQEVFLAARMGRRKYLAGKALSVFAATFLVFTVPFLLELFLNCLSFPLDAAGDLSNWGYYDQNYIESVRHYLMSGLYRFSPYLYGIAGILLFGMVSGILGVFTMAVSALVKVKYNLFLFLPVFLLLNLTVVIASLLPGNFVSVRWYNYLLMFDENGKNSWMFLGAILALAAFCSWAVHVGSRKDCL